jgi:hypothetical protein
MRRVWILSLAVCAVLLVTVIYVLITPTVPSDSRNSGINSGTQESSNAAMQQHKSRATDTSPANKAAAYFDSKAQSSAEQKSMHSLAELLKSEQPLPRPWLQQGKPFGPQIVAAAEQARAGDNRWARELAAMSDWPHSSRAKLRAANQLEGFIPIPKEVPTDKFYWLQLAADRGDVHAQLSYVSQLRTMKASMTPDEWNALPPAERDLWSSNARKYMQAAIDSGVADGLSQLSAAYQGAEFGLPYDITKSHACLLLLQRVYPTAETQQKVEYSAKQLRPGELERATLLAQQPNSCRIS